MILERIGDMSLRFCWVTKALTLIQYMLENGPEDVIQHCKRNLHSIKTLREFQYIDETGHDQGANGDMNLLSTSEIKRSYVSFTGRCSIERIAPE
jgi:hypothetical protein